MEGYGIPLAHLIRQQLRSPDPAGPHRAELRVIRHQRRSTLRRLWLRQARHEPSS